MFLLWAVLLGLLIGFLRRGSLVNLARLRLSGLWLILVALVIQLLIFPLGSAEPLVKAGTAYLHLLSYLFLLAFIGLNWRYFEILLMGAGLALNLLVITVNGGYMPASASALRRAGLERVAAILEQGLPHGNTVLLSATTKLNLLGDILYVPSAVPLANAFSIGDLLLALGIILFLAIEMPRAQP
ncbi:MAG: DUF5317 domain-containing protein [Candidatus Bipolaricaulia bacterium]